MFLKIVTDNNRIASEVITQDRLLHPNHCNQLSKHTGFNDVAKLMRQH